MRNGVKLADGQVINEKMSDVNALCGVLKDGVLVVSDKDLRSVIGLPVAEDAWERGCFWHLGDEYEADFNVTFDNGQIKCCMYALHENADRDVTTDGTTFVEIPVDRWQAIVSDGGNFSYPRMPL